MLDGRNQLIASPQKLECQSLGICVVFDQHSNVDVTRRSRLGSSADRKPPDESPSAAQRVEVGGDTLESVRETRFQGDPGSSDPSE